MELTYIIAPKENFEVDNIFILVEEADIKM